MWQEHLWKDWKPCSKKNGNSEFGESFRDPTGGKTAILEVGPRGMLHYPTEEKAAGNPGEW